MDEIRIPALNKSVYVPNVGRCGTCRWFAPSVNGWRYDDDGECHRHAPVAGRFLVKAGETCGDYSLLFDRVAEYVEVCTR